MLDKIALMFWTWGRRKTLKHIAQAYKTLGVVPAFNSRSHVNGGNGRTLKLEPLTAVHCFNTNVKLGVWDDFDKIGDGYPKNSKYARGFEAGWFNYGKLRWDLMKKHGMGYVDGHFLRVSLKRG